MEREFTCFFTGHRKIPRAEEAAIKKRITDEARILIEDKGVTDFITGGALGFDTLAAEAVIALRREYDYIKLHLYLPCYNRMSNWRETDMYNGRLIMSKADDFIYVTEGNYITGCMQRRNKKMAVDAKYCVAYMKNPRSGTAQTVAYAEDNGDTVINIAYGG